MATTETTPVDRVQELRTAHAQWEGESPEVINGPRALYLAATVGFGSLCRLGHKRGDSLPGPAAIARVMADREYTSEQVTDLLVLAESRSSKAAKHTAKACRAFLKRA